MDRGGKGEEVWGEGGTDSVGNKNNKEQKKKSARYGVYAAHLRSIMVSRKPVIVPWLTSCHLMLFSPPDAPYPLFTPLLNALLPTLPPLPIGLNPPTPYLAPYFMKLDITYDFAANLNFTNFVT